MAQAKSYIKLILYVIATLGFFMAGLGVAFFTGTGVYVGQSIVDGQVFTNELKYYCSRTNDSANCDTDADGNIVYNTSNPLPSYTDYGQFRDDLNANVPTYINGFQIIFVFLSLVFLFAALNELGLFDRFKKKESKKDEY